MAEPKLIPNQYATQNPAIASYDYNEIAENTGIVHFYGAATETNSSTNYILTKNPFFGSPQETVEVVGPGQSADIDLDFYTLPFNVGKTLRGKAILDISIRGSNQGGGTGGAATIYCKLQRWDGTTATDITSEIQSPATQGGGTYFLSTAMEFDITQTRISQGDQIVLHIRSSTVSGTSSNNSIAVAHDPTNSDGATFTDSATNHTSLNLYLPFRLEF